MAKLNRRNFLKIMGMTGTTALTGCSAEPVRSIIPHIIPPEDIVPGKAAWYATTCRECPAGCGILAKNREGRVIKVEGNPLHPINKGKLCARGQASIQGLYHPDRFRGPMLRNANGTLEPISWDQAEHLLVQKLKALRAQKKEDGAAFITGIMNGAMRDLVTRWLSAVHSRRHLLYEPFSHEALRTANRVVFGYNCIPSYSIDEADLLISFGADFLETWLSPVEYAGQFAAFRSAPGQAGNNFFYVGPRLSLTAASADHWISVRPGDERAVALGMLRLLLDDAVLSGLPSLQREQLRSAVHAWSPETTEQATGVKQETLSLLARSVAQAKKPLFLAGSFSGTQPTETAIAANLLCLVKQGTRRTMDFTNPSALSEAAADSEIKGLAEQCLNGEVDLLLMHDANPLFSLPGSLDFAGSMRSVPFIVSFASMPDETCGLAHLILPSPTPLESWGDYAPRAQVTGLMQPVMGPLFNTRHPGDVLISTGKACAGSESFPWVNFQHLLQATWADRFGPRHQSGHALKTHWYQSLETGGSWKTRAKRDADLHLTPAEYRFPEPAPHDTRERGLSLVAYPTIQFFDGRGASRPWLQELPDPMTQICWGGWVEINPETAARLNIRKGDMLVLASPYGTMKIPAFLYHGVHPGTLAIPIGQGHSALGRYAEGRYANPALLLPPDTEPRSGSPIRTLTEVSIEKTGENVPLAHTDGSSHQHGREIARSITLRHYVAESSTGHQPHLHLPLPEGYDPAKDFYPPHDHPDYRWGMVVDLDRCIGCSACLIACNAENNVAIVGKKQVLKGREMFWIRIERYFEQGNPGVRFIPMLCQHCENAPCEPVCPVYAPHHGKEGLNNQVYNRCIGTRFCSQNCPYKVRRFNWLSFTRPEPLNWQYNPDVTVRDKGVMEKCSFCIQRITEAKNRARNESRSVQDGELLPACVQTCPTDALVFGNLKDPGSRVSQLMHDSRAYQVLDHLNTRPAVIYLKKVVRDIDGAAL